jgi:leucyl aminopeptidase (aminopeptidase T)
VPRRRLCGPFDRDRRQGHGQLDVVDVKRDLGVATVVRRCLAIKPGEEVLVLVDPGTRLIGEALQCEATSVGAETVLAIMAERETHGTEPPRSVAAALRACDVFIAPTTCSITHTEARKRASDGGARGATMPGVTVDILERVMAVDWGLMTERSRAIAEVLSEADEAHVTCPRGTDLRFDLRGRAGLPDDGVLIEPGACGNLPCGEGYIAPLSGDGRVVIAGSLAALGTTGEPATLTIQHGTLTAAEGGHGPRFLELLRRAGDLGTNLAELGVGTNDRARLTGNVFEDEKSLGTIHVAFGASASLGGTVSVPIHLDAVVLDPTLDVGRRRVLDAGQYVLDDQ